MNIEPGTRIGHYEIGVLIGAGGMGEVYRARDTKLKRDVALKILPDVFAGNPERMARFQREAEVLASLNHPHIATIYGVEERALAMELIEGQMLAGPLPLEIAVNYAKQMAQALEYAHERGVVHRDLKPANVKITPEGKVKLLDFGLAKATDDPRVPGDASNSPTLTLGATSVGVILGTAAYMSPEQAAGKVVDRRSDIWSFGAVLYEMLSGKAAFAGESASDTLASVLKLDPDWNALPASTPESIRKLIRRCLTKDRNQRLQAIGEARIELEHPSEDAAPSVRGKAALLPWLITALTTVTAVVALWAWVWPVGQERRVVMRFADAVSIADQGTDLIALSRDGSRIAFVAGPQRQIYVRKMDQFEATPLAGTDNAYSLSFSPDGDWISYVSGSGPDSKVKKISVAGGPAQVLANAPSGGPPFQSWGEDDYIYFSIVPDLGLHRVRSSGGKDEIFAIRDPKKGDTFLWSAPQLLPDRKHILVSMLPIGRGGGGHRVATIDLQTGERKILLEDTGIAVYAATGTTPASGHILYYAPATGSIMAVAFDVNRLEVRGSPVPVLEGVRATAGGGVGTFAFSESGSLAYAPGSGVESASRTLVWVDRQGVEQPTPCPGPRQFNLPRLSPDDDRVAFEIQNIDRGQADIWVCDLMRGTVSRITSDKSNILPLFMPDGKRVIYRSTPGDVLLAAPIDGGPPVVVSNADFMPDSVFPDGSLVIGRTPSAPAGNVSVLSIEQTASSGRTPHPLETKLTVNDIQFSPDGKWIAYQSREGGRPEIYVQAYPGPGGKTTISSGGGTNPRWSRSGELFYRSGEKMMAVEIQTTPVLRTGTPKLLFERRFSNGYDVTRDGKRFLMVKTSDVRPAATNQLNVVVNWIEELKQRVPLK